jgi:NADH-quinone oxidoreductase subunit N
VLATITIVVGNVGALGQSSLKRMLAYSSVAQAGYMLAGVAAASRLGIQSTVFYLAVYLPMNMAAFAVIVARERDTGLGDSIRAVAGLGRERPLLAWPMTISMLALAGIPATAGFIGKFYLIDASVSAGYTWLGVVIVIGSMISLAYYLPVVAAMWMRDSPAGSPEPRGPGDEPRGPVEPLPALAGGSPELDRPDGGGAASDQSAGERAGGGGTAASVASRQPELLLVAALSAAASIFFGVIPQPLFDLVRHAGGALGLL